MRGLPWLILGLLLAGCTVEPPQVQGTLPAPALAPGATATAAGNAANASFDAPAEWQAGQWWRYQNAAPGGSGSEDTRVVTAVEPATYRVDTTEPRIAFFDALTDISTLGHIRRSDLAGEQAGAPVVFFHFPLRANDTWTTVWDGSPKQITVLGFRNATYGGRAMAEADLVATDGGKPYAEYTYAPQAGGFGQLEFFDQGKPAFTITLQAWGTGFRGEVVRMDVASAYRDAGANLQPQGAFTVADGATYLDARGSLQGDAVAATITFAPPSGPPVTLGPFGPCTSHCSFPFEQQLNATAGAWRVAAQSVVQGGNPQPASALLQVVAVTVHRIAVGGAGG